LILWILGREQWKDVFCTISGPGREQPMASFVEEASPMDADEAWIPASRVLDRFLCYGLFLLECGQRRILSYLPNGVR
jgi:hypothetical protein